MEEAHECESCKDAEGTCEGQRKAETQGEKADGSVGEGGDGGGEGVVPGFGPEALETICHVEGPEECWRALIPQQDLQCRPEDVDGEEDFEGEDYRVRLRHHLQNDEEAGVDG